MPSLVSGKRYAQAIFELALEHGQLDRWNGELQLVGQVLQDPDYRTFLKHADVPVDAKIKSVDSVLPDVHPLVRNLVDVLVTRGLVDLAPDLQAAYAGLLDQHLGRQRVEVISAVPLEGPEIARITRFVSDLTRKEVVVSTQVDQSIMGGIVIQIGDRLLDGSTRSRLETLRNRLRADIIGSRN